jgi:hypothetical protein
MIGPARERVRTVRGDAAWAGAIADARAWSVLKEDGGSSVLVGEARGRRVVVKCHAPSGIAGRAKAAAGVSRLRRQWRGALWLRGRGFGTAAPLALLRGRGASGVVECLVMEAVEGPTVLEVLARLGGRRAGSGRDDGASPPWVRGQHALARALGEQVARLCRSGRYNRDHKASNLIVTRLDRRCAEIAIIDSVAIRRRTALSGDVAARMLASLVIEPTGVGCPPRRALLMRGARACADALADGRSARELWRRAEAIVRRHGDPRPRVDPLGGEVDPR